MFSLNNNCKVLLDTQETHSAVAKGHLMLNMLKEFYKIN